MSVNQIFGLYNYQKQRSLEPYNYIYKIKNLYTFEQYYKILTKKFLNLLLGA